MDCPFCGLINPDSAERCDCGYDFRTGHRGKPANGAGIDAVGALASWDDRLAARVVDIIVAGAIAVAGFLPALGSKTVAETTGRISIFTALAYFLIADGIWNGQSLGKKLARIRVVDARTGRPCTILKSVLRNCLLWLLGWLDLVFIFRGRQQRVGDQAAGTVVIRAPVHRHPVDAGKPTKAGD